MKTAILGSKSFTDYEKFKTILNCFVESQTISHIFSGGESGTDFLAEQYAKDNNIDYTIYLPKWDAEARAKIIFEKADQILFFWDGKSEGTNKLIDIAGRMISPNFYLWYV